jgi:hypothetical protein
MTRSEALQQAKQLSEDGKKIAVVFDKEYQDFFITEGDVSFDVDDFYKPTPYEVVSVFS